MPTILVVDDELSMREFLKILLEKEGFQAVTAPDGEKALKAIETQTFDLVISDIRMPGLGGLDLLDSAKNAAGFAVYHDYRVRLSRRCGSSHEARCL